MLIRQYQKILSHNLLSDNKTLLNKYSYEVNEDGAKENRPFFRDILIITEVFGQLRIPASPVCWVGSSIEMATLAHSCPEVHTQPLFATRLLQVHLRRNSAHSSIRVMSSTCNTSYEDLMHQCGHLFDSVHFNSCLTICDRTIYLRHIDVLHMRNDELFSQVMYNDQTLFISPSIHSTIKTHVCYSPNVVICHFIFILIEEIKTLRT